MTRPNLLWLLLALSLSTELFSQALFTRGDCNADGNIVQGIPCDLSDPIFLLGHLFLGNPEPSCMAACDANGDGELDLTDAIYQLSYCFLGGEPIPEPFPLCGQDPAGTLGCLEFKWCGETCDPQDASGVGACEMIIGVFWDGFTCRYLSGCSCEGEDCDARYESIPECYLAHAGCASFCDPMQVAGVGPCDAMLGWYWNGTSCEALSGCSCEGADCDRLFGSPADCEAATSVCPLACDPMDVKGVGECKMVLGYGWNGKACELIGGCSCEGADCGRLFASIKECEAAFAPCLPEDEMGEESPQ